jgi:hypothetical protein
LKLRNTLKKIALLLLACQCPTLNAQYLDPRREIYGGAKYSTAEHFEIEGTDSIIESKDSIIYDSKGHEIYARLESIRFANLTLRTTLYDTVANSVIFRREFISTRNVGPTFANATLHHKLEYNDEFWPFSQTNLIDSNNTFSYKVSKKRSQIREYDWDTLKFNQIIKRSKNKIIDKTKGYTGQSSGWQFKRRQVIYHDASGNAVRVDYNIKSRYDRKDAKRIKIKVINEYDTLNNIIKNSRFSTEAITKEIVLSEYIFDEQGNWIICLRTSNITFAGFPKGQNEDPYRQITGDKKQRDFIKSGPSNETITSVIIRKIHY